MPASQTSLRDLARRVDKLAEEVAADRHATLENTKRLDALNLNGSAEALRSLAPLATYITAAVEQRREREIVWRWVKRAINPFTSAAGKFVWLLLGAFVSASAWIYISNLSHRRT